MFHSSLDNAISIYSQGGPTRPQALSVRSPTDFQYQSPSIPTIRSPTSFQYGGGTGGAVVPTVTKTYKASGGGWLDGLAKAASAVIPTIRSPTDFQYAGSQYGNNATTNTVEVDGGTRIFGELKAAAKATLLGRLDGALNGNSGAASIAPANYSEPAQIAGLPVTALVAVAVVGGLIYMKFG